MGEFKDGRTLLTPKFACRNFIRDHDFSAFIVIRFEAHFKRFEFPAFRTNMNRVLETNDILTLPYLKPKQTLKTRGQASVKRVKLSCVRVVYY